jgi:hypothetical protein
MDKCRTTFPPPKKKKIESMLLFIPTHLVSILTTTHLLKVKFYYISLKIVLKEKYWNNMLSILLVQPYKPISNIYVTIKM